jgi:NADPH:quinone reductase-like Zn-dependent oxidoreductase
MVRAIYLFEQVTASERSDYLTVAVDRGVENMKAVVYNEFGGPEVLHVAEVDKPVPGPGQVLLAVRRAGVNPLDYKFRSGEFQIHSPRPLPATPGLEAAGVIEAVGPDMRGFAVGDEVLGWPLTGSYAQYALASLLIAKPATLDWDRAAALPVVGETALRVLALLGLRSGETLLIHGATGATGAIATQLAVAQGVTVIGTGSATNSDYLASLGATPTTYGEGLVERVRALAPNGIDAVLDAVGHGTLPDSIELRGGTERIVTIADPPAAAALGVTFSAGNVQDSDLPELAKLAEQVANGQITIALSRTFALADAAAAHELVESGHPGGKILIDPN